MNNVFNLSGTIIAVNTPKVGTNNGREWKRQEFVMTQQNQKNTPVFITGWGSKFPFDLLVVGNKVSVQCEVKSNEFKEKWYTHLDTNSLHLLSSVSSNNDVTMPTTFTITANSVDDSEVIPF